MKRKARRVREDLTSLWWLPVLIAAGVLVYPLVLLLVWSIAHRP